MGVGAGAFTAAKSIAGGVERKQVKAIGWNYTAMVRDGVLEQISIDYDFNSAKGIEAYAIAMRQENEALYKTGVKEVASTQIVLNHPLSWDEADKIVRKYGLYARSFEFRGVNQLNTAERSTHSIGLARNGKTGEGFDDNSKQILQDSIDRINHPGERQVTLEGVIGIQAGLTYEQYKAVSADKDVYLVEMPRQIIKSKIQRNSVAELNGVRYDSINSSDLNRNDVNVNYVAGPLYRHLEDQKLIKTP